MEGEGGGSGGGRTPLLVGGLVLLLLVIGGAVAGALVGLGVIGGGEDKEPLVQAPATSDNVRKGKVLVSDHQTGISEENVRKEENAAAAAEKGRDATEMGRRNRTSVSTGGSASAGRTLQPPPSSPSSPSTTSSSIQTSPLTPTSSPSLPTPPLSPSYEETWPPSPRPPQILPADSHPQVQNLVN